MTNNLIAKVIPIKSGSKYHIKSAGDFCLDCLKHRSPNGFSIYTDASYFPGLSGRTLPVELCGAVHKIIQVTMDQDLESVLGRIGFVETDKFPRLGSATFFGGIGSIAYRVSYKENSEKKKIDSILRFYGKERNKDSVDLPGFLSSRIDFYTENKTTDAIYTVTKALLKNGSNVAIPNSEDNINKYFRLKPNKQGFTTREIIV